MADTPNTDQPMTVEAATARRAEMVADPAFVERYLSGGIPERDEMLKVSTALSIDPANSAQSFQTEQQISTLKNIADLSDDHIAEIRSGRAVTREERTFAENLKAQLMRILSARVPSRRNDARRSRFPRQGPGNAGIYRGCCQQSVLSPADGLVEAGLCGIYRDGADDINFLEAFDDVRRIVSNESITIKQRLLAIGKRMELRVANDDSRARTGASSGLPCGP